MTKLLIRFKEITGKFEKIFRQQRTIHKKLSWKVFEENQIDLFSRVEMEDAITAISHLMGGFKKRFDIDKERIHELEDGSEEMIQMTAQIDKKDGNYEKEAQGREG